MLAVDVYPQKLQTLAVAVDTFVKQALRVPAGSMFTPERPVWTAAVLDELKERFVDRPDYSKSTFREKLDRQLAGASDAAIQLMAEAMYVYLLVDNQPLAATRRAEIAAALARMRQPVEIPKPLLLATEQGLGGAGIFYRTKRPYQIAFLIELVRAWRRLGEGEQASLLADPWRFKALVANVPGQHSQPMRMAVLHMVFPDTFEMITSAAHKRDICRAFPTVAPNEPDEDRRLLEIRKSLGATERSIHTFYRPDIEARWRPTVDAESESAKPSPPVAAVPLRDDVPTVARRSSVADRLSLPPDWVAEVEQALRERRQIIFHGPPGTGKTKIARELAGSIAAPSDIELVQFHPSYSYEDFVESLRPTPGGGALHFAVQPGALRRVAARARAKPEAPHVLIIDEMNRADLARVLGELLFLLEYRDESVLLPYSGERFSLPPNLLLIGTMNSADRSIALMDAAIRRRFAFFRLAPDCRPIDDLLGRWLDRAAPDLEWLVRLVERANDVLDQPDHAIGPAFFLRTDLSEATVERIWRQQVLPYLDELLHDAPERRRALDFRLLRGQVDVEAAGAV